MLLHNILPVRSDYIPNDIFISKLLNDSLVPRGERLDLHSYLSECLAIGDEFLSELAKHDELHGLLTEVAGAAPAAPAAPDANALVKQILMKYNKNKTKHLESFTNAAAKNPELKTKIDALKQNIQAVTPGAEAGAGVVSPMSEKISGIVTGLVSKMGSSIEQKASAFGATVKDPAKLQKVMADAIAKIKPTLKGDDGKLITDIQELIKKNPGWANVGVGILINVAKMASIGLAGASGGTSVAVGAIAGIILRTTVGRIKGEDWGTAAKKAIKVTGISLLSGAALKGIIGMFQGTGFLSGMKSYFGFGGAADHAAGTHAAATQHPAGATDAAQHAAAGGQMNHNLVAQQADKDLLSMPGEVSAKSVKDILKSDPEWFKSKFIPAFNKTMHAGQGAASNVPQITPENADQWIDYTVKNGLINHDAKLNQIISAAGGMPQTVKDTAIKHAFDTATMQGAGHQAANVAGHAATAVQPSAGALGTPQQLKNVFDHLKVQPGMPPHNSLQQAIGAPNYKKLLSAMAGGNDINSQNAAERKLDHMLTSYGAGGNRGKGVPQQLAQMLQQKGIRLDLGAAGQAAAPQPIRESAYKSYMKKLL